jgi:hypothetical protein
VNTTIPPNPASNARKTRKVQGDRNSKKPSPKKKSSPESEKSSPKRSSPKKKSSPKK